MAKIVPESLTVTRDGSQFVIHRASGTMRIGTRDAGKRKAFGVYAGPITTEDQALECARAIIAAARRMPKLDAGPKPPTAAEIARTRLERGDTPCGFTISGYHAYVTRETWRNRRWEREHNLECACGARINA